MSPVCLKLGSACVAHLVILVFVFCFTLLTYSPYLSVYDIMCCSWVLKFDISM